MEGQILKIDLSNRSCKVEALPDKILRKYLGGRGLGAYLLYRFVPPRVDPFGQENHLIFSAGPANGTGLLFSGKSVVTTKSPLTNVYLYSVSSGTFCHQMRKAGFWAIDVTGIADSPVYVVVDNGEISFGDATPLWGMEPAEAQRVMRRALPGATAATIAIGPSGEKLIRYAAIMAEGTTYRAFGRGGTGCVMGSKRLKGIVVTGDSVVGAADKHGFNAVKRIITDNLKANKKWVERRRQYGTGAAMVQLNERGILPTRNWSGGQFEGVEGICPATIADKWPRRSLSCAPFCPAPCSHHAEIKSGPYQGAQCDGPEYETIYAFGSNCDVDKFDALVAAAQICDENGLDTMSAGISIGFAMECFERGLIGPKDTGGIELRFGDAEAMLAMLKKIVNLEGFGKRLAEGVKRLSLETPGSEAFAMQVKGLELGGYECRGLMAQALQFAINNRGGCHHAYGLPAWVEGFDGTGMQIEGKGQQVKNLAVSRIIRDCLPICTFPGRMVTDEMLPDVVSSLSGESWSFDDLREAGVRIMCQERLFNMREGITRKEDSLPPRLLNEPKPDGPTKGVVVPLEELKDQYYGAMGWDLATGSPPDSLLDELEIDK